MDRMALPSGAAGVERPAASGATARRRRCSYRRGRAAARRNGFAGSQNGQVAGLLHGSESEVVVVVLAGDDASVDLIGPGAGIERAVWPEGERERMIGRVNFDARFGSVRHHRVRIGARRVGPAAQDRGLGKELRR